MIVGRVWLIYLEYLESLLVEMYLADILITPHNAQMVPIIINIRNYDTIINNDTNEHISAPVTQVQ